MATLFTLVVVLLFSFLFAIGNEFASRDASNVSSGLPFHNLLLTTVESTQLEAFL
jgi:hypothetical protein